MSQVHRNFYFPSNGYNKLIWDWPSIQHAFFTINTSLITEIVREKDTYDPDVYERYERQGTHIQRDRQTDRLIETVR